MSTETVAISFPGGKLVDARIGRFTIRTDQAESAGGYGSAPEPFDLFLASIGSCAGIFAWNFCQARGLSTQGMALRMHCERDPVRKRFTRITLELELPAGFPERYRDAIARAMELCSVKRHILEAPEFRIELSPQGVSG